MNHWHIKRPTLAFSLLELLVIAAIVTVIAAFAIPGYTNYITQTRINALWQQAEAAKLQVESIYLKQNTPVGDISVDSGTTEYTTSNVDFVKCITVQDGVVSVVGEPDKFSDLDIWIAWQPTQTGGALTWSCIYSADAAPYVTNVANTCAVQTCQEYSSWDTPSTLNSETFWYFGTLDQGTVSSAFANNCSTIGSMAGCSSCYNFANTSTEQHYMTFDLNYTSYNYQGALGSDPNWSSYSSWSYQYDYTQVTQSCMSQTRTASTCANVDPFSNDSACN